MYLPEDDVSNKINDLYNNVVIPFHLIFWKPRHSVNREAICLNKQCFFVLYSMEYWDNHNNRIHNIILVAILCFGAFVLLYHLDYMPLWEDEAVEANVVKDLLDLKLPEEGVSFFSYNSPLQFILPMVPMVFFGSSVWSLRIVFAFLGILSLFLTYYIARQCVSKEAALIAVAGLATSVPFLLYMRTARHYAITLFATLLFVYIYLHDVRLREDNKWLLWFSLAGVFLFFTNFAVFLVTLFCCVVDYGLYLYKNKKLEKMKKCGISVGIMLGVGMIYFLVVSFPQLQNTSFTMEDIVIAQRYHLVTFQAFFFPFHVLLFLIIVKLRPQKIVFYASFFLILLALMINYVGKVWNPVFFFSTIFFSVYAVYLLYKRGDQLAFVLLVFLLQLFFVILSGSYLERYWLQAIPFFFIIMSWYLEKLFCNKILFVGSIVGVLLSNTVFMVTLLPNVFLFPQTLLLPINDFDSSVGDAYEWKIP